MEKKINYLARTFSDYRSELINFSKKYYADLASDFNDSSVGAWFIDLVASAADNLSYHIDRAYQETNVNTANLTTSIYNLARANGYKIPGPKASMCEVQISCDLPIDSKDLSSPDWDYAPILRRNSTVAAGNYNFHLTEDVDFAQQFNSDAFSNRTFVPKRNSAGAITSYTVSKTTIVTNGTTRIFKKVLTSSDIQPFMEVILPDKNVMNVESVIFKESADFSYDPDIQEFYYDEEQYKLPNNDAYTYRFFEVNSLADQWRFGTESNFDNNIIKDTFNPELYEDYAEGVEMADGLSGYTLTPRTTRFYKGKWKPITQKFITETTDNNYMKLIFGSGINYDEIPSGSTKYGEYRASKLINNDMLGVLPKQGWTMYVLYEIGGGEDTNLGIGAINNFTLINSQFHTDKLSPSLKGNVLNSFTVTNLTPSIGGKDAPSTDEVKYLSKYNVSAQDRCVTLKDYKLKLMSMPPKYGAPFRSAVAEVNNKIQMSLLGLDSGGHLDKSLPSTLVDNILEYMSHYRTINDYIEVRSGKIYNLGFSLDVFIDKTYNVATVLTNIINKIKDYMDIEQHDMGENIFIGDLEKELTLIDGVLSLISLRVYNIYDGDYSTDIAPFPRLKENASCYTSTLPTFNVDGNATAYPIDLEAIDRVLQSDYNSMFEILNPKNDIQVRVKLK